jgi:hypothetical protein
LQYANWGYPALSAAAVWCKVLLQNVECARSDCIIAAVSTAEDMVCCQMDHGCSFWQACLSAQLNHDYSLKNHLEACLFAQVIRQQVCKV